MTNNFGDEDDCVEDSEDLIPGDNDKPSPTINTTDAPDNLTHIPASGGDVPVVLEPPKP